MPVYTYLHRVLLLLFFSSVFCLCESHQIQAQCNPINFSVSVTSNYNGAAVSCPNACDGEITVTVTSAGGPFGYTLEEQSTGNTTVQTNPVFSNLCGSGNYTITVTDSSQEVIPGIFWCNEAQGQTLNDPLLPVPSFGFQQAPTCADSCDGFLQGSGALGTAPLTLSWPELGITEPSGQNNSFQSNLCSGSYLLRVTDVNGCFDTLRQVVVQPPSMFSNITLSDALCDGDCNGSAVATGIGGNGGPFTYSWDNVPSSGGISNTNAANGLCDNTSYTLHMEDNQNCPYDTTFNTVDVVPISIGIASTQNASCSYSDDGAITITVNGGTGNYTSIQWFGGSVIGSGVNTGVTGLTNNSLFADSAYYVVVTDDNNCTQGLPMPVLASPGDIQISGTTNDILCNGDGNGSISVTASGGNGSLNAAWTTLVPGSGIIPGDEDQTGLSGGTYKVVITDDNGCQDSATYVINEPNAIFSDGTVSNVSCSGLTDGNITLNLSGGTGTLNTTWNGPPGFIDPNTDNLIGIDSGTYQLNITDDNGCNYDTTFLLITPSPIYANGTPTDVSCYGFADGGIDLTTSNGNFPYQWAWTSSNGFTSTNEDVNPLDTGNYFVTISDNLGCTKDTSFTINQADSIDIDGTSTNILCNGDINGVINVVVSGGNAPLNWTWSSTDPNFSDPGNNATNLPGLGGGDYTINVFDNKGCLKDTLLTISEPQPITTNITVDSNASCNGIADGGVTVVANGGTVAVDYSYLWDDPSAQNTASATNLAAGSYTVIVTDDNGCNTNDNVTISEPDQLFAIPLLVNHVSCNGLSDGSATSIGVGGTVAADYTYLWDDPTAQATATATNLAAGTYTITITDDNGCSADSTIDITQPNALTATHTIDAQVSCFGLSDGQATVTPSGGTNPYTYLWDDPAGQTTPTATGLAAGTYNCTITDNGAKSWSLNYNEDFNAAIGAEWDDNSTYVIRGETVSGNFANNDGLTLSLSALPAHDSLRVVFDFYALNSLDGNNIQWGPDLWTLAVDNDTLIHTTFSSPGGHDQSYPNEYDASNVINNPATSSSLANGDGANGSPRFSKYFLNHVGLHSSNTANISFSGFGLQGLGDESWGIDNVKIYLFGANALAPCQHIETVVITEPSELDASAVNNSNVTCFGGNEGSATGSAIGGTVAADYQYSWNDPANQNTALATGLVAGTYQINITDDNGCEDSATVTINEPQPITTNITVDSNASCNGISDGGVTVVASGGTISPSLVKYTYGVTASNSINYTFSGSASGNDPPLVVSVGDTLVFNINSPGHPFFIKTTNTTGTANAVSVANNGISSGNITWIPDTQGTYYYICQFHGGMVGVINVNANNADYSYLWDDPSTQNTASATNLAAGSYTVIVTDDNGCNTNDNVTISEPDQLFAIPLLVNHVSCNGLSDGSATSIGVGGTVTADYTYLWDDPTAQATATATNLAAGTYTITITDDNGCSADSTIDITQPNALTATHTIDAQVSCFGLSDGQATVTPSGGTNPYTYLWDDPAGQTTPTATGLAAGTYNCTITDNGAKSWNLNYSEDFNAAIGAEWDDGSGNRQTVIYRGESVLGEFNVNTTGQPTLSLNGLPAHDSLRVVFEFYGFDTWNGNSTNWGPDFFTISVDSDTLLHTTFSGRNASQSYPSNYFTNNPLSTGAIADSLDRLNSSHDNTVKFFLNYASLHTSNSATISLTDGLDQVRGNESWGIDNVKVYLFGVNSLAPCQHVETVVITEPNELDASAVKNSDVTCFGGNEGSATGSATGGTVAADYQYSWNDPANQNTALATGLVAGTYQINITDDNGCEDSATVTINEPTEITTSAIVTNVSCNSAGDGSLDLTSIGGLGTFLFDWDNDGVGDNDDSEDQFSLNAGTYCVSIIDQNRPLCQLDTCFVITESAALNIAETITNVDCSGDSTGAINLVVTGGVVVADYNYSWVGINTGFTSSNGNISNLIADQYSIVVTDDDGCTDSTAFDVTENNALAITPSSTDAACGLNNGDASVVVTGGVVATGYVYSWEDNTGTVISTSSSISAVGSGTYQVFVNDDLNCTDSATIIINDLSASTLTIDSIKHESCAGDNDGLITVTITVSPPPGQLTWSGPVGFTDPGGNNTTISGLGAGQYIATLTDGAGCVLQEVIDINEAQSLTVNDVSSDPTCFGAGDGSIDLFVSGGNIGISGNYTYDWDNDGVGDNDDSEDLSSLGGGNFNVTVYDDAGCSTSQSYTLNEPSQMTGSTTANVIGCGLNDGTASVTVNGGTITNDYTYIWTDNSGLQVGASTTITSQPAGCYNIDVTDDNGCLFSDIACINNPTGPNIALDQIDSVSCFNGVDGNIFLTVTTVNNPPVFAWQTVTTGSPTNSEDLQNVNAGTYSITVTDNLGCVSGQTYTVYEPNDFTISSNVVDLTCNNDSTGSIDLTVSGGTTNYNYSWTGPNGFTSTDEDLNALIAGSYQITGSDNNGCIIPATIIDITEPTAIGITLSATPTDCDQPSGSITIVGNGGSVATDYTYELTDLAGTLISSSSLTSNLDVGQYIGFVYDDRNCFATDTIEVTTTGDPTITLDNITDVNCAGEADGSIFITVNGGSVPYNYLWSGTVAPDPAHETAEDFENWFAGTYSVTVTDDNGCTSTLSNLIIDQPATLFTTSNNVDPLCSGDSTGSITLNPSGGTPPYLYEWESNGIVIGNGTNVTGLPAGSYDFTVTDDNNCEYSNTIDLISPNALSLTSSSIASTCSNSDGTASISVTGGTVAVDYNYAWTNTQTGAGLPNTTNTVNSLSSGIYQVLVTDDNGCTESANITVSDSDGPTLTYSSSNIACFGVSNGTIDLTVVGNGPPYTYSWTGPAGFSSANEDLNGLEPGNYAVFVTDPLGCSSAENIAVGGPNDDIQIQSSITQMVCNSDSSGAIAINIIGGTSPYNINWSGPNGFTSTDEDLIDINEPGDYTVSVTDANGCPDTGPLTETYSITEPSAIIIDTNIVQPTCDSTDGILYVTVSGGTVSGDYTYVWDDISTPEYNKSFDDSLSEVGAGNYVITVTDDNLCSDSVIIAISDLNGPTLSAVSTNVDCIGDDDGTIDLTIAPIGTYNIDWDNDGTGDFDDNEDLILLAAGSYNVVVEDALTGCKSSLSVDINVGNTLDINLSTTSLSCNNDTNGTISTTITGGTSPYSYDWALGGFTVSTDEDPINLSAGYYILTLTDDNGCQKQDSIEITEPTDIFLTGNSTNSSCGQADGSVNVTASGGTVIVDYVYSWFDIGSGYPGSAVGSGNANENNLVSGSYQVLVSDDNGCIDSVSVSVSDDNAPTVAFSVTDVECFGDSTGGIDLAVNGISPFTYSWTGPVGFNDPGSVDSIGDLIAGSYSVIVTDDNGCTKTKNINVTGPATGLNINSTITDLTCNGDSTGAITVQINGGTAPYQTNWTGPSGYSSTSQNLVGLDTGTYVLNVTDDQGCQFLNNVFYVSQPDSIEITGTITSPTCNALDGSISIVATGGTIATNYQYSWDNLSTPAYGIGILTSLSNIGAGNYQVTVTDDENCTGSQVFAIANANAPTLTAVVTQIDCNGNTNGEIDLTITGTSSYTIDWDNDGVGDADDSEDLTNLSANTYSVTVNDLSTGCVSVLSEVIMEPDPISIGATVNDVTCNGANDGEITVFLAGGTGSLTPSWTTIVPGSGIIANDTSQTALDQGTYKLIVTDVNSCADSSTYTITEPDTISISYTLSQISCSDSVNGSIEITEAGGTGALIPAWNSTNSSFTDLGTVDLFGLDSGIYNLSLTDDNGCIYDTSFLMIKPDAIVTNANIQLVSCFGNADAEIKLNTTGGDGNYSWNWSGPNGYANTNDTIIGLDTGQYQLVILDGNLCQKDTLIEITQPNSLNLLANINSINCFGDTSGKINLSLTGGSSPFQYDWDIDGLGDNDDDDSLFNLPSGSYHIFVTDDNGCTLDSVFTLSQPQELTINATISNNACSTDSNGVVELITTGGVGGYIYNWSSTSGYTNSNDTISQLHSDTFNLNLTDGNLCQLDTFFVVTSPSPLYANITLIDANCGFSDGSATANPFGGTVSGNYIFDWDIDGVGDNDDNPTIPNLLAGVYSLTVIDDNNCTIDTSIIISNTSGPQITVNNTADPSCHGGNDGSIDLSVSGGNQPYQIFWNPNQTSQTSVISNLFAGEHVVHVIDAVGCTVIDTITLNEPSPILIDLTLNNSTCQSCDGTASAVVSGGNPSAIYNTIWSNGNSGNLASSLCSGIYTISVSDNFGCSKDSNFTISDDLTGISVNPTLISPNCPGALNGSISLSPTGGASPYNYVWMNNGSTSSSVNNLPSGEYEVLITDNNGCTEAASFLLNNSTENIDISSYVTPADCNANNGNIKIIPNGGTAPYTYSWSNNSVTDSIFNLSAGLYTVTVTDNNGCSNTANIGLPNFNNLTISTVVTHVACFNENTGSISATVSGNTGSTTNTWFDENGNNLSSGVNVSNLSAGNYTLQVVDDISGCYQFENISIEQNTPIQASLGNTNNASCDVSCDGEASLVVYGGSHPYSYLWDNGASTSIANNLCEGLNNVLITDVQGCTFSQAFIIEKDDNLTFTSSTINATCGNCDGVANLTAVGGSGNESFTWFDGIISNSHPNLCAGVHGFELIDNATGCSVISSVEVSDIGGPDNSIVNTVNPTCFNGADGSASVIASGGTPPYNYNWIPSGQNTNVISGLSAGLYHLEVIDNNNCKLVVPVSITNPSAPVVEQLTENATCGLNNGAISLIVYQGNGSYSYSWNGPNGFSSNAKNISNLEAGVYELTISDGNGCLYPYTFTINSDNGLTIDLIKTDISCFGINDGSISSTVSNGSGSYNYLWSTSSTNSNINNLGPGVYSLTVTDVNTNCISSDFVELLSPDSISISTAFVLEPSCFGQSNGQASVSVSGGNNIYAVNWTGMGIGFEQLNLSAGNYPITVTDQNNCTANGVVTINQPDSIQVIVDQIINSYCVDQSDGEIYISVIGGISPYNYSWINTGGTYSNTSDQDINNLLPGTYIITIIDQNLCSNSDTITVDAQNTIIADAGIDSSVCVGGCLDIIGSGLGSSVLSYSWSIVDSTTILSTDSLISTYCFNDTNDLQFVLSVSDQSCSDNDTITISVNPLPIVDAGLDVDEIYGADVELGGQPTGPVGSSFVWSPSINFLNPNDSTLPNPDVIVLANQSYSVTVTDINGCQNSDDINIILIPDISYSSGFSPNNDGVNDTWSIDQIDQFPNCNVEIYNRWGTLLFKSVGYNEQWTGLFNEKPLPIGTYYFVIKLNDPLFPDPVTGPVTIIR